MPPYYNSFRTTKKRNLYLLEKVILLLGKLKRNKQKTMEVKKIKIKLAIATLISLILVMPLVSGFTQTGTWNISDRVIGLTYNWNTGNFPAVTIDRKLIIYNSQFQKIKECSLSFQPADLAYDGMGLAILERGHITRIHHMNNNCQENWVVDVYWQANSKKRCFPYWDRHSGSVKRTCVILPGRKYYMSYSDGIGYYWKTGDYIVSDYSGGRTITTIWAVNKTGLAKPLRDLEKGQYCVGCYDNIQKNIRGTSFGLATSGNCFFLTSNSWIHGRKIFQFTTKNYSVTTTRYMQSSSGNQKQCFERGGTWWFNDCSCRRNNTCPSNTIRWNCGSWFCTYQETLHLWNFTKSDELLISPPYSNTIIQGGAFDGNNYYIVLRQEFPEKYTIIAYTPSESCKTQFTLPQFSLDDKDHDGYTTDVDCNDNDPTIHPNAVEIKNDGIDQDCDGHDDLLADSNDDGQISDSELLQAIRDWSNHRYTDSELLKIIRSWL